MALPILDGNQTAATLSTIIAGGQHIPAHTVVSLGSQAITDMQSAVSGSVVSISNFPATQTIAGTVTANVQMLESNVYGDGSAIFGVSGPDVYAVRSVLYSSATNTFGDDAGAPVDSSNPLPISGTVTANAQGTITAGMLLVENANNSFPNQNAPVQLKANPLNGSLRVRMDYSPSSDPSENGSSVVGNTNATEIGTLSYIKARVVAGSVTIGANPSGALTTRFGSVTTANTAQITSAVTNTSRKYLLAQNISAGTVTIGIGFSPTTTQGIQLTAGAGLTFDAFCPTGAVYWLGATTGATWTILEG